MNTLGLTIEEQHNIDTGSWFSKLSPALKTAILSRAAIRRLRDGDALQLGNAVFIYHEGK